MHAIWEQIRPDLGLIRVGPDCYKFGDPYDFALLGDHKHGEPVELMSLAYHEFRREYHDAIGLCLLSEGFVTWSKTRYKSGKLIPPVPIMIYLSSTFLKELIMSIELAHAHAQKALGNAIAHAQKAGFQDFAAALTALGAAADAGIPAAQGADLAAQGDATRNIFIALQGVQLAGLAIDKKHAIHSDVMNVFNAMEGVANATHASNKARLHAALAA